MAFAEPTIDSRFPIGKFTVPTGIDEEQRKEWLAAVEAAPQSMREAVKNLDQRQLDTPYREGGWTVRQVVHHVPESHMNAYIRFKLALTEDTPVIKPYLEDKWALLPDVGPTPIEVSLQLLEALHSRWVSLMKLMSETEWKRTFHHPEMDKDFSLETSLAMYAWHGRHHVAHITVLRTSQGWS